MLVLWDPTWTENLWCLVELAAFLKSRQNPEQQLIIRPIFLEPFSLVVSLIAIGAIVTWLPVESDPNQRTILLPLLSFLTQHFLPFLLCALTAAYAGVSALRSYFRSVESMQQRLLSVSFDETRCSCCDRNHVSPSGKPMLCDRKVFTHCIIHWFGGRDAFEDILRTEVRKGMAIGLREGVSSLACHARLRNPVRLGFLGLGLIELLSVFFLDLLVYPDSYIQSHADHAASYVLHSLGLLLFFPEFVHLVTCVCKHMHARPDSHRLEFAKNAVIVLVLGVPIFGMMACIVWVNDYPGFSWKFERSLVFWGCFLVFAIFSKFARCLMDRIAGEPEVTVEEVAESFRSRGRLDG